MVKRWKTPNLTKSVNLGAPVQTLLSPISLKLGMWEYAYSGLFRTKLQHDRYIISHLAAKKSTLRPQFLWNSGLWGGLCYPPSLSPIMTKFCVQTLASFMLFHISQSNNTAKFDWIWPFEFCPWHFTVNVKCGFGNRVFLTLWTMAIRSNMVASFEQKMPSKALNSTLYRVGRGTD